MTASFITTKQCLILLVFAICSHNALAQSSTLDWSDFMTDPDRPLSEVILEHQLAWPQRPTERGQGFKQLERFISFQQSRLNDHGKVQNGTDIQRAWNEVTAMNQNRSQSGNWYSLGPIIDEVTTHEMIQGVGRVMAVAFHPTDPQIMFAGAPAGGVWRSLDGGSTWSTNTDQLPTLGISSIVIDPQNPLNIYAGTGDRDAGDSPGMGVIKSIDGGETWDFVNTGMTNLTVGCLRVQQGTNDVWAATNDGIFKTADGGLTWIDAGPNTGNFKDLEFHPTNNQIVYATSNGRFYRSIDGGVEWDWIANTIGSNIRMCISVSSLNPDLVYVIKTGTYSFSGFYKSTDAGATFTLMSNSPNIMGWAADGSSTGGQAWYDLCMETDPDNSDVIYVGGIRAKKSLDAGVTWIDINNNYLHVDMHEMAINPHNHDLYLCNDGGLYHYEDNTTWKDISAGMVIGQIYQLGQSPHNPNHTLNGFQDNGTMEFDGVYWNRRGGGDGFECAYDFSDPQYRYGSIYYGELYRTTPEVVNEKFCGNDVLGINEEGAWNTPFQLLKSDATANTMFVGLKNIWRSFNIKHPEKDSIVWVKISDNLYNNSTTVNEIELSDANPNMVYVSKDSRRLFRADSALAPTPTWVNLTSTLPVFSTPINAIETNPADTNIVYICFHNDVYRSADKGVSWSLLSANLPEITTNTIVLDKTNPEFEALYLGTDMGVYYKDTTMTDFIPFNQGMPLSARVTELEIFYGEVPSQHRLKASTYGRGMWESDLFSAQNSNFPAVASVRAPGDVNEVFGTFDVNIIFYKNLDETEVTQFDNISSDLWVENAIVQSISGGPAQYTATLTPQSFGPVRIAIPASAALDINGNGTYQSDTLKLIFAQAPAPLGFKGPGGVGDEESITFWMRADRSVNVVDGHIQSWLDILGSPNSAVQLAAEKRPLLVNNELGISGRPAVSFDGENDLLQMVDVVPGRSISAFVMVETDTIKFNDHGWFASARMPNGYLMHPWKDDYYYHNEVIDANGDYSGINSFYIGDASAPHIYGFVYHQDDLHQVMTTLFDETKHPQPGVNIGARNNTTPITVDIGHDSGYEDSRFGKGRIAEHFVYSERLMETHQSLVSNYMASLYGIDLGPSSRYHHPEQKLEVFGIGRTSDFDYHATAQGLGIIKLFNATSLDDGDFLMIGNDEGDLNFNESLYPFQTSRVNRTWGFTETGDCGDVTIRIDPTNLTNTAGIGVIYTTDNEFMPGSDITFVPLLIQGPVLEATLNLPSEGVFTIGYQPTIGVEDLSYASASIFPNPTKDVLQVQLKNAWPQNWNIEVIDALGKTAYVQTCSGKSALMDVSDLSTGFYFVQIHVNGKIISRQRILKQ